MTYPRLAQLADPARSHAGWGRTALGLVLIMGGYFGFSIGAMALVGALLGEAKLLAVVIGVSSGSTPIGLVLVLLSFLPLVLGVLLVTRFLHHRPISSLFGPGALRDFGRVFPVLLALVMLIAPLALFDPNLGKSTPVRVVLTWLPLALPLLFVQIAAEELLFRGYLLQQIAARTQNPLWWMAVPAALFGALHYAPAENGANAILFALWAMGFGCLAADLTARAGNLGPALAFHFANNISAMFLVGLYGQLDGLSLYTLVLNTRDLGAMAPYLITDCLSMGVFWLLARLRLRR